MVHSEPVSTVADLIELECSVPAALQATGLGLAEMMKVRTLSGGGGVNAGLPALTGFMSGYIGDIIYSQGNDLAIEQSLDIAITAAKRPGPREGIEDAHRSLEQGDPRPSWIRLRMPFYRVPYWRPCC